MKKLLFLFLVGIFTHTSSLAQKWAVNSFVSEIEDAVAEVNAKASAKDIVGALDDLSKLNSKIRFSQHSFQTEYTKAREEDGSYQFSLNVKLLPQMSVLYWGKMLQKVDRNKKQLKEAFQGIQYDEQLDAQDEAWAYLKTIYNAGKMAKDMVENASEGNFFSFFFTTKDGIDQFVEDYKNIENAGLQKLETASKAQNIKLLISKAKRMERNYIVLEEKIRKGFGIVDGFNEKVNVLRKIAANINQQPQFKIDWTADRYSFKGTKYLDRIRSEGDRLKSGSIQWANFKNSYSSSMKRAFQEKENALTEIRKSDDTGAKRAKSDEVRDAYETFSKNVSSYFKSLEQDYADGDSMEDFNYNYKLQGFGPIQYPTGQRMDGGHAGEQFRLSTVQAEADVQSLINLIHAEVKAVNQLANQRQMKSAINTINSLNRRMDADLSRSFKEDYRKSREGNPNFKVEVKAKLSSQFKAAYWENSLKKTAKRLTELRNMYFSTPKSNARKYWEVTYAICKNIYDVVQLPQDAMKELKESGKQGSWDKVKESIDGIKDDYVKVEAAFRMKNNDQMRKDKVQILMNRARTAESALESMASYMRANEEEASRFYTLLDRLNKIKKEVESGPSKFVDNSDSRYNFDETAFDEELEELVKDFNEEEISWNQFDQKWNALIRKAESQKDRVIANLRASDDLGSKKSQAINTETLDWDYFDSFAKEERDKLFDAKDQSFSSNKSNNEEKQLFAGSEVDLKMVSDDNNDNSQSNSNLSDTSTFYGVGSKTNNSGMISKNKGASGLPAESIENKEIVGKITNFGNGTGKYCSLDVNKLSDKDILEFKKLSGSLNYVQIIWRNTKGHWFTKYSGSRTKFEAGEFLKDISSDITHLNFVVNAKHNRYKQGETVCEMEVYHYPSEENSSSNSKNNSQSNSSLTGSSAFEGADSKTNTSSNSSSSTAFEGAGSKTNTSGRIKGKEGVSVSHPTKDRQKSQAKQATTVPKQKHIQELSPGVGADFNVLLNKAADAFNKKYWKEEQGQRASSNPKQESLNYLKRAQQLIDKQAHIEARYSMVYRLLEAYSEYAKRVFANTAKVDFINAAGSLVSRYGGKVSSVTTGINGKTPAEERSVLYVTIAGSWRELTKAAMWGDHAYNKAYCDKQTKTYYERALNENPSDYKIKRILESINAPKKAR